jgi:hypothetical protein
MGENLSLQFEGDWVEIIYIQHPTLGKLTLELDGILLREVISTGPEQLGLVTRLEGLGAGLHTLRVFAQEGVIAIDAFRVSQLTPTPTPEGAVTASEAKDGNPILSSDLNQLAEAWRTSGLGALSLADDLALPLQNQNVQVMFWFDTAANAQVGQAAIQALGGQITASYQTWVDAWLPISALDAATQIAGVGYLRPVIPVEPVDAQTPASPDVSVATEEETAQALLSAVATGANVTQGRDAMGANLWHSNGWTGRGVTIGIIDSFKDYTTARSLGELPATINVTSFTVNSSSSRHGTAVAEIIYDLAPEAQLIFASPTSATHMASIIDQMSLMGVDIISSSVGFYNAEAGDGLGVVSNAISTARTRGTLYVQAAGNQANYNWQGTFYDPNADSWHEWSYGDSYNDFYAVAGQFVSFYLRWNAWPTTNQDYDFYLYRWTGSSWSLVASSVDAQTGSQPPIEDLWYVIPTTGYYALSVKRYGSTTGTHVLDLMGHNVPPLFHNMTERSLIDPATGINSFSVAALNSATPFSLESYSSRGPSLSAGGGLGVGNNQPRISGFANVNTWSYGTTYRFNGTSSAAPHVAGAAALLLSAYPGYTPAQLISVLEANAVDMGASGYDFTYGMGRLNLPSAPPSLNSLVLSPAPPLLTNDNTPTLTWTAFSDATYQVQFDNTAGYTSPEVSQTVSSATYTSPTLSDGLWYWRVRALRGAYIGNWISGSFTLDTVAPTVAPNLTAPMDSALQSLVRPMFSWGAVATATRYELQVDNDADFTSPEVSNSNIPSTVFSLTQNLTQGWHHWRVRGIDAAGNAGPWSATRQVGVNINKTPNNNSQLVWANTATSQLFTWSGVTGATGYTLQIAADTAFTDIRHSSALLAGTATSYTLPATHGLGYGTYYWRVLVNNLAFTSPNIYFTLTLTPPLPLAPTLGVPVSAGFTNNRRPSFTWNAVTYAPAYGTLTYEIQVDNQSTFTSPEFSANGLTTLTATPSADLPADGVYSWRVRAVNQYGGVGAWSLARTFTLDTVAPTTAPALTAPTESALQSLVRPMFSWGAVATATRYELQVDNDGDFTSPEISVSNNTTNYSLTQNLTQGWHSWRVRGIDAAGNAGPWSATRQVGVNINKTPNNNSQLVWANTATSQLFTWSGVTGATGYTLQIAADTAFTDIRHSSALLAGTATSYTMPATHGLGYGTYYWRVLVNNLAFTSPNIHFTLTITPPLPLAPTLTAPASAGFTNNRRPSFTWNAVTYAPAYGTLTYEIQVDNQSTFTSPEFSANGLTTLTATPSADLPADGVYSWRVRAVNQYGGVGAWSLARTFTLDTLPLAAPTLSTPIDNAVLTTLRPTLTWALVTGAKQYEVQVNETLDFSSANAFTAIATTTSASVNLNLPQRQHYWRVRTIDMAGNVGAWSNPRAFYPIVANQPAQGTSIVSTTPVRPTFTWHAITGASSLRVMLASDSNFTNIIFDVTLAGNALNYIMPSSLAPLGYGPYWWHLAVDSQAGWTQQFSVSPPLPALPSLTAPANLSLTNDTTPTLTWSAVSYTYGPLTYQVQVDNQSTFTSPEYDASNLTVLSLELPNPLSDGLYYWRVRATNQYGGSGPWSSARTFTVDTLPVAVPTLSTPADNSTLNTRRPSLTWLAVTGANAYDVRLVASDEIQRASSTLLVWPRDLAYGTYSWQVRSLDAAGNPSAWSTARTFTLSPPLTDAPLPNRMIGGVFTFNWTPISWALDYELQISSTNAFSTFTSYNVTNPTYTLSGGLPSGIWYWRVRARTTTGVWGSWSTVGSFVVEN